MTSRRKGSPSRSRGRAGGGPPASSWNSGWNWHRHEPRMVPRARSISTSEPSGVRPEKRMPSRSKAWRYCVVELVAMPVALVDDGLRRTLCGPGFPAPARTDTRRGAWSRPSRRPLLLLEEADHRVGRLGSELGRVGASQAGHVPRELDARALHAEADAEERECRSRARSGSPRSSPRCPRSPNPPGDQDAFDAAQVPLHPVALDVLGLDPPHAHLRARSRCPRGQRLVDRLVGVGELDVLSDERDLRLVLAGSSGPRAWPATRRGPAPGTRRPKCFRISSSTPLPPEHHRDLVDGELHVLLLDHRIDGDVAEERDLPPGLGADRLLRAADQDVGQDADLAQLPDASAA